MEKSDFIKDIIEKARQKKRTHNNERPLASHYFLCLIEIFILQSLFFYLTMSHILSA